MKRVFLPEDLKAWIGENIAQGKALNIMNDVVFKTVFSADDEDSREALRLLLSSILHRPVSQVQIINAELVPEQLRGKTVRLDLLAAFDEGERADMEMQMAPGIDNLRNRAAFLAARLLSGQGKRGKRYGEIKRAYQVFFVNGVLFPGSAKLPRRYYLMEETEHDKLTEAEEIIFYELPKLDKLAQEYLKGRGTMEGLAAEEKWCLYFRYRREAEAAGLIGELCRQEEGIMRAERALAKVSRDERNWARAYSREIGEMDYRSGLETARAEGIAEGEARGRAEGEARGRAEGIVEGETKGATQAKLEIARKMKAMGLPVEQIAQGTGLTQELIETL